MATVSTFNIALIASTSRFVSNMARAERQWNQFARSVQRQSRTLPKALRDAVPASLALGRNVAKWTAVATAALGGLSAAGVKLAADFEQSQIAFETMLGDAERARRFLRELEVYARRTPFGFVGLQQASRQLLAYGFTAGRVLDMIEPIGDAVAAMGGSNQMFEAIIRALGQIQAKGKLAAQEFLQLSEQGIPAWQFLADTLGVAIPEAMDMASRGMISSSVAIEAVLTGMTRRFGGAMRRQAETMAGRWEQLKDSITTITREFGRDALRITGLGNAIGALADAAERFAEAVSMRGFIGALREAFPPWVQPVIVAITGAIVGGLVPAILAWLIPALKKLAISLWATLKPLTPWMAVGAAVALTAYVLARNWGNLAEVGQRVWTSLGAVAMYGASLVVRGSALIYQALSFLVPGLRGAAQSVLGLADSLRNSAAQALQTAMSTSRVADQAASAASTAEEAAWAQEALAQGLEMAQQAAKGGVQSFDEVHQVQENLADAFVMPDFPLPDFVLPQIESPIAALSEGFEAMHQAITNMSEAATSAWDALGNAMKPVREAVEWLRTNWPGLNVILENTASIITLTLIPALVTAAARATWSATKQVAAWVTTQAQAIASIATQVAKIAVLVARWIWLGAVAVAQGARVAAGWVVAMGPVGWAIAAAAALAAAIWYFWEDIVAAVAVAQAWFVANVAPVWDRIVAAVITAWNTLATAAGNVWAAIRGAVAAVCDWAVGTVGAVWESIVSGVKTAWDAIESATRTSWAAVKSITNSAWDTVKTVITDRFQAASQFVAQTAETIKQIVQNLKTAVIQTIQQMADGVVSWLTSLKDRGVATIQGFWDGATGWFRDLYHQVVGGSYIPDMVNESIGWLRRLDAEGTAAIIHMADGVTGAFGSLQVYMQTSMHNTFNQILNGTMSFSEAMQAIISSMGDAIRQLMAERLARAASDSLATIGNWALGVIRNAAKAVAALVQQAYASLLAFFAWSGPAAPALAGGVIVAGTAAMISLAAKAADAIGLARGGIVTGPTLALMGEGYRREAVIPLERDNVIAESVGAAVFDAMITAHRFQQASGGGPAGDDREIVLKIDGTTFARLILPHLAREGQRQGIDVVIRPAMEV